MTEKAQKRDNQGYLFSNKNKTTEKQPDLKGKVVINGKEWLVSGWNKQKNGEAMISLSLTDPDTLPAKTVNGQTSTARPAQTSAKDSAVPPWEEASSQGSSHSQSESDINMSELDSLFTGLD